MKTLKSILILFMTLGLVLTSACSSSYDISTTEEIGVAPENSASYGDYGKAKYTEDISLDSEQAEKVITTIDLRFETTEFDQSIDKMEDIIKEYGGYIDYSNVNLSSKNYKNGQYVIRVPKEKIDGFKLALEEIGVKVNESINNQNVTENYRDTESRLRVVEVKEKRVLALLEDAKNMEDIIKLEEELSQVIYEKEQLQRNLMSLDDKIEYITVNLYLKEVDKTTQSSGPRRSFGERVLASIEDSLHFFINTFENLVILFIYAFPFLAIIATIVYVVYKYLIKPRKNK